MELEFFKYHALGNDFVVIQDLSGELSLSEHDVQDLCNRHFGIGADGLILVRLVEAARSSRGSQPTTGADGGFLMLYYNADGSQAGVCGNGLRCTATFLHDEGLETGKTMVIHTLEGPKEAQLALEGGQVKEVQVDMGEPRLKPSEIPMEADGDKVLDHPITVNGQELAVSCLSMGNPHCVVFVDGESEAFFTLVGPAIERHPLFPERTNVEFVQVINSRMLKVHVWERGVGMTLACGTGACAAFVAATLLGHTKKPSAEIVLPGGTLVVEWRDDNHVYLKGPARRVFSGRVKLS